MVDYINGFDSCSRSSNNKITGDKMAIDKTKEMIKAFPKSGSIQWATAGTAMLVVLIASKSELTLLFGETISTAILLAAALVNGWLTGWNRTNTTKSLSEL